MNRGLFRFGGHLMGYFKPLRRKFGVITLVMACLFGAGWLRSLSVRDTLIVCSSTKMIQSFYGTLSWSHYPFQLEPTDPSWESSPIENPSAACAPTFYYIQPIHITEQVVNDSSKSPPERVEYTIRIHYWSIVISLTLFSAYLLLSNPRQRGNPG